MKPNLFIFTNGYEGSWPAIEYGAWVAKNMQTSLTLMGIVEHNDQEHPVEDIFSRAVTMFQQTNLNYVLELDRGPAEHVIARTATLSLEQILIFGPFGRPPLRRMVMGNSFRHIMADIGAPMIYVPVAKTPIRQVLICLGGLGYTVTAEHLGFKVAQMNQASVSLLSVVPPINRDYPEARKIQENWQNLAETDTLAGQSLRDGLENAKKLGLEATIKVRHGNIVEQILAELSEESYQLVCMGSQFSAHGLQAFYSPNITADVAESGQTPILTARFIEQPKR